MARGWRVTETYIKCICDSITMGTDCVNVFKYHPVVGDGYVELNGNGDWGDNVIPIEYDRFKTRVELLKDLGYSVMFIAQKLGTTEEEVWKIVGKDYIHKDYSEMRSEYFMLLNEISYLRDKLRTKNDEIETLEGNYKALRAKYDGVAGANVCGEDERKKLIEENANLKMALECAKADNLQFEHRGKELTEKNDILNKAIESEMADNRRLELENVALGGKVEELTEENARLSEANDILTKRIVKANNEIDDLKRQYEMLQAKHDTLSGVNACWNEENEKLTKQISDLRSAYDRIYRSRYKHIKHNEALERKVKELTTENEEQRTVIKSLTEYKDSWVERAHQHEKELATVNAKNDEAMREMNCLRIAVSTWRAQAFDYKKRYKLAKSANTSISNRCDNLAAEIERLRVCNKSLTDLVADNTNLRSQRNQAIKLLTLMYTHGEIANALGIDETLVMGIAKEVE